MVEPTFLSLALQYAVAPLGAFCFWMYKKNHQTIDKLGDRVSSVETSTAVIKVMVDSIHQDIRDIKRSLDKLADRGQ
jgi:hypothetical protein